MQHCQHGFDISWRSAEFFRDLGNVARDVTGVVHEIDQIAADQSLLRIGNRKRKLFGEMIGKRRFGFNERFQIILAVFPAALAA